MRSFYRLSEKLARTVAELSLFCREHLVNDEMSYLSSALVVMNAFQNAWGYWIVYEYDGTYSQKIWEKEPEEAEGKMNDKS